MAGSTRDFRLGRIISTKYRNFNDPYISLPSDARTQLTADCAVILNWFAVLAIPDDCDLLLGDVSPALMLGINTEYRKVLRSKLKEYRRTLADYLGLLGPLR